MLPFLSAPGLLLIRVTHVTNVALMKVRVNVVYVGTFILYVFGILR